MESDIKRKQVAINFQRQNSCSESSAEEQSVAREKPLSDNERQHQEEYFFESQQNQEHSNNRISQSTGNINSSKISGQKGKSSVAATLTNETAGPNLQTTPQDSDVKLQVDYDSLCNILQSSQAKHNEMVDEDDDSNEFSQDQTDQLIELDYMIEFDQTFQEDKDHLLQTQYNYDNRYVRVNVQLTEKKRNMEEKLKKYLIKKNPELYQQPVLHKNQTQDGKSSLGSTTDACKTDISVTKKRRPKKRRITITYDVLLQVQDLLRKYQAQQSFLGTPLYRRSLTFKNISDSTRVSETEIKHLYEQYKSDPLFIMRFSKLTKADQRCQMLNREVQEKRLKIIENLVKQNCVITQREIAEELNNRADLLNRDYRGQLIPITRKTVQSLMKKANYSRKKVQKIPKNRNSPGTIENRYYYCLKYMEVMELPNVQIYFLDQSRFNMMTSRDRGWAKRGLLASKVVANSKGKDITLLAMIGIDGVVFYQLADGYNAAAFTISMDRIGKVLNQKGPNPHRYIVMDNCPIHNRQNLRLIEEEHHLKILYLPPYTPMLNPIQHWFNQLKNIVRAKTHKTRVELRTTVETAINLYRTKSFSNYYGNLKQYLELGIKKELILQ